MMNKKYRILLLLSILIVGGFFLFFLKIRDFDFSSHLRTESFMRNLTWQTDFQKNIPFKKGDMIEYTEIYSSDTPRDLALDISSLKKLLDITQIELDGQIISEDTISNLHLKDTSSLKIIGKAKTTNTNDIDNIPTITTTTLRTLKEEETIPNIENIPDTEPQNITLQEIQYNSNINNLISITGTNLARISLVNIGGVGFKPITGSGILYVQVSKDTFATGEYFVFFELNNGKIITLNDKITFQHSSALINIANITPNTLKNDMDRYLVIQGNGFDKIISIQLSNNLILKNAEFHIINKQVAEVKIPKGLPIGEYYFNIMDTSSIYELHDMKFTITH
ncbi:MAG: hypothetical protein PHQ95_04300 [Candidatus Gracilibacteria bacterium]|nr:hypothetical protein [Candidatus Gracilibacteria bacterium]